MTYEEAYQVAYAIGFHRGRMRKAQDLDAIRADVNALESLMDRIPKYWLGMVIDRHEQGVVEGEQT